MKTWNRILGSGASARVWFVFCKEKLLHEIAHDAMASNHSKLFIIWEKSNTQFLLVALRWLLSTIDMILAFFTCAGKLPTFPEDTVRKACLTNASWWRFSSSYLSSYQNVTIHCVILEIELNSWHSDKFVTHLSFLVCC